MSSDKDRDIENVQSFVSHLSGCRYSGVLNVVFYDGSVTSISRKEEFNPDGLHKFLHRPLVVRKKAAKEEERPEEAPSEGSVNSESCELS